MSRNDFFLFAAWCAVPLWLLFPTWMIPSMVPYNFGDLYLYHYPMRHLAVSGLHSGQLPFWNPYIFLGLPLSANSQSVLFYPVTMLAAFLPLGLAFSWDYLFHLVWGALGVFLLARNCRLSRLAALLVTSMYALCPFVIYRVTEGIPTLLAALAWVPWAWLALQSERPALLAGVLGLQFLSGHPQFMVINGMGMAAWVLARRSGVLLRSFVLGGLGGALLAAVQWIPTMRFLGQSVRKEWPAVFTMGYSIDWGTFATWLNPDAQGNPLDGTWPDVPSVFFETCGMYVGLAGVLAALYWLAKRRPALPWLLLGAGVFLALGGHNPLYRLAVETSAAGYLRTPSRYLLLCLLGLVFAAGGAARAHGPKLKAWIRVAFLAVVLAELAVWDRAFLGPQDPQKYLAPSQWVMGAAGGRPVRTMTDPDLANPNKAILYRAMNVNGYEAFYLADFLRYAARAEGHAAADASRSYLTRFRSPEMVRAGVRFYIDHSGGFVRSDEAYPLAYYVGSGVDRVGGGPALDIERAERWRITGEMPRDGRRLVLAQAFYPGWRAFQGDRELELSKWDGALQSVDLPPGRFDIRVVFIPVAWNFLVLLAVSAWGAWLWLHASEGSAFASRLPRADAQRPRAGRPGDEYIRGYERR